MITLKTQSMFHRKHTVLKNTRPIGIQFLLDAMPYGYIQYHIVKQKMTNENDREHISESIKNVTCIAVSDGFNYYGVI